LARVGNIHAPRLEAFSKNNFGGMIFALAVDPNRDPTKTLIRQTLYALEADACVVDVIHGTCS
jgi:hypothetical protein